MHTASTAETADGDRASSAPAARQRTMLLPMTPPAVGRCRPGHTEGDAVFGDKGLFIHVVAQVQRKGSVLALTTWAFFQELESDWTTYEGSISHSFYDAAAGRRAGPRARAARAPAARGR